jgi:hypothetical protein
MAIRDGSETEMEAYLWFGPGMNKANRSKDISFLIRVKDSSHNLSNKNCLSEWSKTVKSTLIMSKSTCKNKNCKKEKALGKSAKF